jgi:hypothetical protein
MSMIANWKRLAGTSIQDLKDSLFMEILVAWRREDT